MNDHVALRSTRNLFSLLISQISFYKSDTSRSKLGTVIQRERRAKTDTVMTQLSEHLVCRGAGYPDIIMSVDAMGGGGGQTNQHIRYTVNRGRILYLWWYLGMHIA